MTHPIVKAVSNMVYEGDIDSAERALALVADSEGDFALSKVIEEMPARDVVAILREHDASKASIVGHLISPQQFLAAVTLEKDYGERNSVGQRTHDSLRGMVNGVVFADEERIDTFVEALGSTDGGMSALADYFSDRHEELEFFFRNGTFSEVEGEHAIEEIPASNVDLSEGHPDPQVLRGIVSLREVQDHDWRELAWRLRCEHYEIFRDLMEILRSRHHKAMAAPPPPPAEGVAPDDDEDDVL
ncbi:MAG TPA: hypothetical protein VEA81_14545 [Burkholderiaceae bacterium]|nr:hypothetical protein [Burkholderiaceae bacterium]